MKTLMKKVVGMISLSVVDLTMVILMNNCLHFCDKSSTKVHSCLSPNGQVAIFCDVALATADHLVGDLHNQGGHPLWTVKENLSITVTNMIIFNLL